MDNVHINHRSRLRERYMKLGADGLDAHELLELFLFDAIPRVDTNPIAHRLLERFGSLWGVFNASESELTEVKGIGEHAAGYIASAHKEFCRRTEKALTEYPMSTFEHVSNYLIWHRRCICASNEIVSAVITDEDMHFRLTEDYPCLSPEQIADGCRAAGGECVILGVGDGVLSPPADELNRYGVCFCDVIKISGFNAESIFDN